MPILANANHERFCREIVKARFRGNRQRAGIAYRAAGYTAKLEPADNAPADNCAYRLLGDARIQQRIGEIIRAMNKRHDVTEDSLLEELEQARQKAWISDNGASAMVQATVAKAKIAGLMIERKETGRPGDFENMSDDQLRAWIADRETRQQASNQATARPNTDSHESVPAEMQTETSAETAAIGVGAVNAESGVSGASPLSPTLDGLDAANKPQTRH